MLQKCYNRNNSVTNGDFGTKSAIVKSGDQIIHPEILNRIFPRAHSPPYTGSIIRTSKLEAGPRAGEKKLDRATKYY